MKDKILYVAALLLIPMFAMSNSITVTDKLVTKVQVYEMSGDSVNVWLHLDNNPRVGPNPVNASETCELWTNDKTVYSTALAAFMSGKKVSVRYVDRGEGTYWCKVNSFSVSS